MQNFEYKVLNNKNIELLGSVSADTISEAKLKLENLGYKIIDLKENDNQTTQSKNLITFKFEGYQNSKGINGNIQASSFNKALIELTEKYQIKVVKLANINATNQEFEESKIKINNFLKRLDFHSNKKNINKKNNFEEIYIFIESLTQDFVHYFEEKGIQEIENLKKQYIQVKNSNNKAQKLRILKSIFKTLLDEKIYKKSASKSGLEYIFKETITIFHKISIKNSINLNLNKINILLTTGSNILRELLFKEFFQTDSNLSEKINIKELKEDLKSIGIIGTIVFFLAIFLVNLQIIQIQIPSVWYKVGILFFSVYSTFNLYNLLPNFNKKNYVIISLNLLHLFLLIKI